MDLNSRTPTAICCFSGVHVHKQMRNLAGLDLRSNRPLLGFGHLQDARAFEIRISEQTALEEDDLTSCIAG